MSDLGPMARRPTSGGGNLICTSKSSPKNEIKKSKISKMKWLYNLDGFVEKHLIFKNDGFVCTSYLIYCQIWLNLPIEDCHFGCISYFIKKNTWVVPGVFQWCSHTGDCPQKELAKYDYSQEPCFFFFSFDIKILLQFNKKNTLISRIYARKKN